MIQSLLIKYNLFYTFRQYNIISRTSLGADRASVIFFLSAIKFLFWFVKGGWTAHMFLYQNQMSNLGLKKYHKTCITWHQNSQVKAEWQSSKADCYMEFAYGLRKRPKFLVTVFCISIAWVGMVSTGMQDWKELVRLISAKDCEEHYMAKGIK